MGNAQLGLEICWGQNSDKKEECEAQWVDPNQSVQIFLGKWSCQFKCSNRANNAEIPIVHYFLNFWWPRKVDLGLEFVDGRAERAERAVRSGRQIIKYATGKLIWG